MALNSNPVKAVAYLGGDEGGCVPTRLIMEQKVGAAISCTTGGIRDEPSDASAHPEAM